MRFALSQASLAQQQLVFIATTMNHRVVSSLSDDHMMRVLEYPE
jgi:hypothetical protein